LFLLDSILLFKVFFHFCFLTEFNIDIAVIELSSDVNLRVLLNDLLLNDVLTRLVFDFEDIFFSGLRYLNLPDFLGVVNVF